MQDQPDGTQACNDLDNCPACRFKLQFDNPADFDRTLDVMDELASLLGVPPIASLRGALLRTAIQQHLLCNAMPASPDVAAAQAATRESGGQS